ncbi:MAG: thioesterase family protein [Myxococcota bacterium]
MSHPSNSNSLALYERDADRFVPTRLARGPWHNDSQHGGPVQGLLARCVQEHPSERPMQVVRFTCDLWRAAAFEPLTVSVRTLRDGKAAEWLEAELRHGDQVAARATALRLREEDVPATPDSTPHPLGDLEDASSPIRWLGTSGERDEITDFVNAIELRPVEDFIRPAAWLRLRVPLVAGEDTTPFVAAATLCDMVYGLPIVRDVQRGNPIVAAQPFVAINVDTSLQFHRSPRGEWIGFDAEVRYGPHGAGLGRAALCDEDGALGYAQQSLLLRDKQAPPAWESRLRRDAEEVG